MNTYFYKFTDGILTMGYYRELDTFKLYYLVKGKTKTKARSSLLERQLGWMKQYDSSHVPSDDVMCTFYVQ